MVRFTIDNRNRLIFYGNTVGYVKDDAAVVDEMFQTDELSRYLARLNLTPQWKEGIFDRLAAGETPGEELGQPQKGCRMRHNSLVGCITIHEPTSLRYIKLNYIIGKTVAFAEEQKF